MLLDGLHQGRISHMAGGQHHIGFDDGAALRVGLGHHGGIGHSRVFDQAVLYFARPDAVACGLEHVVAAPLVPEVTVVVHHRHVARAAPAVLRVAGVLGLCRGVIAPIPQKEGSG